MNSIIFWIVRKFGYHLARLVLLGFISRKLSNYILSLLGLRTVTIVQRTKQRAAYLQSEN